MKPTEIPLNNITDIYMEIIYYSLHKTEVDMYPKTANRVHVTLNMYPKTLNRVHIQYDTTIKGYAFTKAGKSYLIPNSSLLIK